MAAVNRPLEFAALEEELGVEELLQLVAQLVAERDEARTRARKYRDRFVSVRASRDMWRTRALQRTRFQRW